MTDDVGKIRYVPLNPAAGIGPAARRPFDLPELSVTGVVIICELGHPPPGNSRPTMSMKITQYLRLSDESMIRMDMDRGVDTFRYGRAEPASWKRSSAEVISEVLTLVKGDEPDSGEFPWQEYAEAARLRGILIEADRLRDLPFTVLFSDEIAQTFEF